MSPELLEKIRLASDGIQVTSIHQLVQEFIVWTTNNCTEGTLTTRRSRINKFSRFAYEAGISEISQLNNAILSIYFENKLSHLEVTSRNADKKVIKAFINWVEEYKEIPTQVRVNAIKMAKEPKQNPKYLDFSIIEKLIDGNEIAYMDRLLIAMASMTGLRASEIASLKPSHITDDRLEVRGKGNNEGTVTIPAKVMKMIETYIQLAPYPVGKEDYVFKSLWRGEWNQITGRTIWRRVSTIFMRIYGIKTSPHPLRHSYAVHLLLSGCDIVTIQRSLRHTDIKITQRYLNIADLVVSKNIHSILG